MDRRKYRGGSFETDTNWSHSEPNPLYVCGEYEVSKKNGVGIELGNAVYRLVMDSISKVLFIGNISESTPRNKVIFEGLKNKGIYFDKIGSEIGYRFRGKSDFGGVLKTASKLLKLNIKLIYQIATNFTKILEADILVVPSFGNYAAITISILSILLRKKIILDSHGSVYYTQVLGRKYRDEGDLVSKMHWMLDKLSIKAVDRYLVFSKESKKVFSEVFNEKKQKFSVVYTGALRPEIDIKKDEREKGFSYWGGFIPFHGVPKLLDGVKKLRDEFGNEETIRLMGDGEEKRRCEEKVSEENIKNVEFKGFVPQQKLEEYINISKATVGVFGKNAYTDIILTNKICEAAARGKAIVTRRSPAVKELFSDKKSIYLVEEESEQEIAKALYEIAKDDDLRHKLSKNSRMVYEEHLSPSAVASQLISVMRNIE